MRGPHGPAVSLWVRPRGHRSTASGSRHRKGLGTHPQHSGNYTRHCSRVTRGPCRGRMNGHGDTRPSREHGPGGGRAGATRSTSSSREGVQVVRVGFLSATTPHEEELTNRGRGYLNTEKLKRTPHVTCSGRSEQTPALPCASHSLGTSHTLGSSSQAVDSTCDVPLKCLRFHRDLVTAPRP